LELYIIHDWYDPLRTRNIWIIHEN